MVKVLTLVETKRRADTAEAEADRLRHDIKLLKAQGESAVRQHLGDVKRLTASFEEEKRRLLDDVAHGKNLAVANSIRICELLAINRTYEQLLRTLYADQKRTIA